MTPALLDSETREQLRSKAERIDKLVTPPESVDQEPAETEGRVERRTDWYRRVEDAVLDLVNVLPAGVEDYEAVQLFRFLTELRRAIIDLADGADTEGRAELAAMKLSDVARRLERRLEHSRLEYPEEAAKFVFTHLDALDASDQASLFGVSTKTLGAWKRGGPVRQNRERVVLVAQLLSYLRRSMTQTGVMMWFNNSSDILGRKTPLSLLESDRPDAWSRLIRYARGGRGQLAD